jgi:hypothetical protein
MNTYIKTDSSTEFAAVRASRAELIRTMPELKLRIVPASAKLRGMARRGTIPTLRITETNSLGYL